MPLQTPFHKHYKSNPKKSEVENTGDLVVLMLEDGACLPIYQLADEALVSTKTVRRAIKHLRAENVEVVFQASDGCWRLYPILDPDWDQISIREAADRGYLSPEEFRRLRAASRRQANPMPLDSDLVALRSTIEELQRTKARLLR